MSDFQQIIDPSTGKPVPQADPDFGMVELADPSSLPKQKPDPYADVDVTDFSNADEMSRVEALTLAHISEQRGMSDVARAWKQVGVQHQQREDRLAGLERMAAFEEPAFVPEPGSAIVPSASIFPWENDDNFREAASQEAEAAEALAGIPTDHPMHARALREFEVARTNREAIGHELREAAESAGTWGEQQQREAEAQFSLGEKAGQIAEQLGMKG